MQTYVVRVMIAIGFLQANQSTLVDDYGHEIHLWYLYLYLICEEEKKKLNEINYDRQSIVPSFCLCYHPVYVCVNFILMVDGLFSNQTGATVDDTGYCSLHVRRVVVVGILCSFFRHNQTTTITCGGGRNQRRKLASALCRSVQTGVTYRVAQISTYQWNFGHRVNMWAEWIADDQLLLLKPWHLRNAAQS